jgi:hypothetical protein
MGWETANIHLGSRAALAGVRTDLHRQKPKWLLQAAQTMATAILEDWHAWAKGKALRA